MSRSNINKDNFLLFTGKSVHQCRRTSVAAVVQGNAGGATWQLHVLSTCTCHFQEYGKDVSCNFLCFPRPGQMKKTGIANTPDKGVEESNRKQVFSYRKVHPPSSSLADIEHFRHYLSSRPEGYRLLTKRRQITLQQQSLLSLAAIGKYFSACTLPSIWVHRGSLRPRLRAQVTILVETLRYRREKSRLQRCSGQELLSKVSPIQSVLTDKQNHCVDLFFELFGKQKQTYNYCRCSKPRQR